jgi:cytochrome bd-type quinol oxidase subunit 2
MNPATLFLTIGAAYLALVAYGVVRTRQKGLPRQVRLAAATTQVVLVPLILFGALLLTRDAMLIGGWGIMLAMLAVAGALLAICTDLVARRML